MAIIRDWLTAMGKRPFCTGDSTIWNWASEKEWDPAEKDMCVPHEIYQEMTGRIGYPGCRMYFSEEEAIVDFEQACEKLGTVFLETPPGYQRKPVDRELLEASKAARERGEHGEDIATVITRLMARDTMTVFRDFCLQFDAWSSEDGLYFSKAFSEVAGKRPSALVNIVVDDEHLRCNDVNGKRFRIDLSDPKSIEQLTSLLEFGEINV